METTVLVHLASVYMDSLGFTFRNLIRTKKIVSSTVLCKVTTGRQHTAAGEGRSGAGWDNVTDAVWPHPGRLTLTRSARRSA